MRKLATVAVINAIKPIEGADNICSYKIRNWWVVDKVNKYKVGDMVVYYEIDSILPIKDEFEFLRQSSYKKFPDGSEGFRLRTIKLRGQVSQGLLTHIPAGLAGEIQEDMDLTEVLNITKYEPPLDLSSSGEVKGLFPGFLRKTDEERIQNIRPVDFDLWRNIPSYITEKIDGRSITVYYNNGEFGVCSRNLNLKPSNDINWNTVNALNLEEKLRSLNANIALQGELYGLGVQGNKYKRNNLTIAWFTLFNIDTQSRMSINDLMDLTKDLSLNTVPIIDHSFVIGDNNIDNLIEMADGASKLNHVTNREGLVIRGHNNEYSVKCISNKFLLKSET